MSKERDTLRFITKKGENFMKSTGIVRNIDELGRLVIPKEMRKKMGIGESSPV